MSLEQGVQAASISLSVSSIDLALMMVAAASNRWRSMMAGKTPLDRIHISGWFWTRTFFSLKDSRFQTLLPRYFSLIRIWCSRPRSP